MSQSLKVLIVDDSRVSRMMSGALVKSLRPGAAVVEAADGAAALALINEAGADIGILDMNMPGMNGLELAEELHRQTPQLPLALLTANVQDSVRNRAEAQGVHFFRKPISEALIMQILDTLAPET
ncbi:MAG: response regulator [Gammaproteobacteria bacterium]|nr:response regulator [Gammaproteobacteria bacterium]MCB1926038.1 response regulator [Gammaproteobacteria bacterium]